MLEAAATGTATMIRDGASMARPADCRDHGRPGRQPVVDEYDVLAADVERWTVAMQDEVESHCLRQGGVDGSVHLLLREPVVGANVDALSARRHATDAVLRLARMANLAHCESIERKRQATRDLGRDRDSPAREADDHSTVDASLTECRASRLPASARFSKRMFTTGLSRTTPGRGGAWATE